MVKSASRKSKRNLTRTQLEIMNLFWERGEMGVAQVWQLLGERRTLARNTVQTMLTRLVQGGWLEARSEGNAFYFRAIRPRRSTLSDLVNQLLESAFSGSPSGLIMTLLDGRRLSAAEATRIRDLIDRIEEVKK
jgi:BlaI family transcriptional regulator, penicillinase repressor